MFCWILHGVKTFFYLLNFLTDGIKFRCRKEISEKTLDYTINYCVFAIVKRTDLSTGTDLKYRQTPVFAPQSLHWETVQSSRSWKKFHISSISTGRFSGISPYGTGHSAEQGVQRAVCSGARCVTGTRRNSVTDSSITFRTPAFRHWIFSAVCNLTDSHIYS